MSCFTLEMGSTRKGEHLDRGACISHSAKLIEEESGQFLSSGAKLQFYKTSDFQRSTAVAWGILKDCSYRQSARRRDLKFNLRAHK